MPANLTHLRHRILEPGDTLAEELDAIIDPAIFDPLLPSWSPADLASLQAWWDFTDRSTLYQDSARTVAVTANLDPIGGVTDKSGGGKHLVQAGADTVKPVYSSSFEAALLDNGDFMGADMGADDSSRTVAMLFYGVASNADGRLWQCDTSTQAGAYIGNTGKFITYHRNEGTGVVVSSGIGGLGGWHTAMLVLRSLTDCDFIVDGTLILTFNPQNTAQDQLIYLGISGGSPVANFYCRHFLVFSAAVAGADLTALQDWLDGEAG